MKIHKDVEKINDLLDGYEIFINNIEDYKEKHRDNFINKKYHGFYIIGEKSIGLLAKLLDLLNYVDKKSWKLHYGTQTIFIANTVPFIYSAFDNILNGQYQIASIANRSSFETLLRIYFISFYPDNYGGVYGELNRKSLIKKGSNPIKFNIMNLLNHKLDGKFKDIYSILSHEAHSSIITVGNDLKKVEMGTYKIQVNIQGDIDFSYNMNILLMIIYALLKYINNVLLLNLDFTEISKQDEYKKLLENKDHVLNLLNDYLFSLPHNRNLNEEVNEIMEKIVDLEFNK